MKTIYFHIGLPKTGSSYLQSIFAMNQENYSNNGLLYPDLMMANFKSAIFGKTTSGNGLSIAAAGNDFLAASIKPIDIENFFLNLDTKYNYLFSTEWFIGCPHEFFLKIENIVKEKFVVKYIVCVRKPDDLCKSLFLQSLKFNNSVLNIADIDYFHKSQILVDVKRNINLILNLPEHKLFVINYDYHKNNLIEPIDKIIFKKKVSKKLKFSSVNPSPNLREAEVLWLASQLNITNFKLSMNFIESNPNKGQSFSLPRSVINKIYNELKHEILAINNLLPKNNLLPTKPTDCKGKHFTHILASSELEFLDLLIQNKFNETLESCIDNLIQFTYKYFPVYEKIINNKSLPKDFHPLIYLMKNQDVLRENHDPINHFIDFGKQEGRVYK